mmetsp:Transcript_27438/g.32442  ORF Transcript_27438/g.32442 Transcript_27438/m.32442 type:complete len:2067 (+) Transcript_27438:95-6295(+)
MAYAWIAHANDAFEAVQFVQEVSGGKIEVRNGQGQTMYVDPEQILGSIDDQSELHQMPDDLVMLDKIDEPSILQALKVRFQTDKIYTNIGDILISMNPFKMLPLYTPNVMQEFLNQQPSEMEPHVYAIAAGAYNGLIDSESHESQSVLISGESGAGKTEATKLVLAYLSAAAGSENGTIEQRILAANPILEAFGNAKTLRNNNSSRFGKFVQLHFDGRGKITGCDTQHYLLEKTRIVQAGPNERSYHVFYQLCAGSVNSASGGRRESTSGGVSSDVDGYSYEKSAARRSVRQSVVLHRTASSGISSLYDATKHIGLNWAKTHLGNRPCEEYTYLNQSGCVSIDGVSDLEEMEDLYSSLVNLGLRQDERQSLLGLTAAVLLLGQLQFAEKGGFSGGSQLAESEDVSSALQGVCSVLGLSVEKLSTALTVRELVIRGESQFIQQEPEQACDSRDALAKALYSANFDWIVGRVNKATAASGNWVRLRKAVCALASKIKSGEIDQDKFFAGAFASDHAPKKKGGSGMWEGTRSIGILDIFGFEIFEKNSFEQLCINYANERLQQLFNTATFRAEEDAYKAEGVPFEPIMFADNQDILELIDKKPSGILPLLDEEVVLPRTTDDTFLRKLGENHERKHKRYVRPKGNASRTGFAVKHYAGSVTYTVLGFLKKNKDELSPDLVLMLQGAENTHVQSLFLSDAAKAEQASSNRASTQSEGNRFKRKSNLPSPGGGGGRGKTKVSTQGSLFRKQVDELMGTLGRTHSSFIRCIKPNVEKQAGIFTGALCYEQLRCSGVFEAVTIRRQGYPARLTHMQFFRKFKTLSTLSPDPSALSGLKMLPDQAGVPEDARLACEVLIRVLAQQPPLARMLTECQMGKTMVLWRTDVNKAITLVRSEVEKKAASRIQALGRRRFCVKLVNTLYILRNELRKCISYNGDSDEEVNEVEEVLKKSNNAPFQMQEHYLLLEKFKIILKRRKVAASIEEMSTRTIDQVDDEFVSVCIAAKELDFQGDQANKIYELYALFTERQQALEKLRKAIEQPQIDISELQQALKEAIELKTKFGEFYCQPEELAGQEALRKIEVENGALNMLFKVLTKDSLVEGDPRVYASPSPDEAAQHLKDATALVAKGSLPKTNNQAESALDGDSDDDDDDAEKVAGYPDLRLRAVMQSMEGLGAVNEEGTINCRTKRGAALLPLGVFALKLRSTYIDAVYDAVHNKKRPGSAPNFKQLAKGKSRDSVGTANQATSRQSKAGGAFALRMRSMEASLGNAGMKVDDTAIAKADQSAWQKLTPILEDASAIIRGDDLGAGDSNDMRESVALLSMSFNSANDADIADEISRVQRVLRTDLSTANAAKAACVGAVEQAISAMKDIPADGPKCSAAVALLESTSKRFGPVGLNYMEGLKKNLALVAEENRTVECLYSALRAGMLSEPAEDITSSTIDTEPLQSAIKTVLELTQSLLANAPVRNITDGVKLLQSKNRELLGIAKFVLRLRNAIKAALLLGEADTTQTELFEQAKQAWDGIQKLLLEGTNVDGIQDVDIDDFTTARQLLLKKSVMSDVKEKLIEATNNQWEDWLEFSLFQAEQLGLDYHEDQEIRDVVTNARAVYANIVSTKQGIIDALGETERRSPNSLRKAIQNAKKINWSHNKVDEAILLESQVSKACDMARLAWQQLDRNVIKTAVAECEKIGVDSTDLGLCQFLLQGHEKNFLQKAHRLNQFLGRSDIVTDITMIMKDMFFENAGDMFQLKHFPGLRKAEEYGRASSSMGFKNTEAADGMLCWNLHLHTSLTKVVLVEKNAKQNDIQVKKMIKQLWQCIQGYMGDVIFSYPAMLAQEILRVALEHPALKDEIYCLLLKQLTENPNPGSEAKALDLLQICLQSFAPSDLFVNYLEYYLRSTNNTGLVRELHLMSAEENLTDKKLSLADIGKVTGQMVHSGWMQLRSEGVFNSYTRYWFLMDPEAGKLRYFLQEGNLKANRKQKQLACFEVKYMVSLDELEPSDKSSRNPSIRGKFPFEMGMKGGGKAKVRLVADTEEDRSNWMAALRAAKNASWTQGEAQGKYSKRESIAGPE